MKIFRFLLIISALVTSGFAQSRIVNFVGVAMTDSVRLSFGISAGPSCGGWEVFKGSDSMSLYQVFTYPGICGNTSYTESYSYSDISPNKSAPNYYRIYLPSYGYSNLLRVDIATNYSNLLIYPQPATDVLNIAVSNQKNFYYELSIYDRFGRKKGFITGNATDKITLNVSSLPEGVYVFYFVDISGKAFRGKFMKTD